MRALETDEALWRQATEAEETLCRVMYKEIQGWEELMIQWKEVCKQNQEEPQQQRPRRNRTRTQWYQSGNENRNKEQKEQERKQRTDATDDDMEIEEDEEEAHDWKEGERIGEAKQPGPPKGGKPTTQTPPWNHTPGLRQQQAQAQKVVWHLRSAETCKGPFVHPAE